MLLLALWVVAGAGAEPPAEKPTPSSPDEETSDSPTETVGSAEEHAPPSVVILEGQLTDYMGAGQAGVVVTVRRKAAEGQPGEVIAQVKTDELGDFTVSATEPVQGEVVVTFSKPNHADLVRELRLGENEYPPFLAETLEGVLAIEGQVIHAVTKEPVAGASVTLTMFYKDWPATTDEQGRFTMQGLAPGQGVLVTEAAGYGRERQIVMVAGLDEEAPPDAASDDAPQYTVHLKPERVIRVQVVDDLDAPVAGVTLEALDEHREDFRTAVTDRQGAVTLRGVHFDAAVLTVRLTHPDHVSSEGFDRRIITPPREAESTHRFVIQRAGSITGRVTDRQSGQPLYGARLMTGTTSSDLSPRDWSDYEGRYTITGVKPGPATVTVHFSGYAPTLQTVEVRANEATPLDIQLGPPTIVTGMVKNAEGAPVRGASVEAAKWRGYGTLGLRAMTDIEGRFVIADAPLDEFEVDVFVGCGRPVRAKVPADNRDNLEIKLPSTPAGESSARTTFKVGDAAPIVSMTTMAGESLDQTSFEGKTVLLDFWATWCPPCIAELPELKAAYEKFGGGADFVMVGISLDWDEKAVRDFVKERGLAWPQVFGPAGHAQSAADSFGVVGIPATFIIGPDGKILAADLHGAEIGRRLEQLLQDSDSQ